MCTLEPAHRLGTFIRGTARARSGENVEAGHRCALEERDPRARMPTGNGCRGLVRGFQPGEAGYKGESGVRGILLRALE